MGDLSSFETLLEAAVASAISSIRSMSYEQLSEMLNDDSKIDAVIENVPQVRSLPEQRDLCSVQNKSLSEYNLSQEPQLEAAKAKLLRTYEETIRTKQEVSDLKQKLDTVSEQRSLDTLSAVLQAAAQSAEDESEATVERYMNSEIEVEQFVKEFNEKKTLAHLRKIKAEKLLAILRQQQYPSPPAAAHTAPYRPSSVNAGIPYPVQPSGMYPQPAIPNRHSFWS